MRYNLNICLLLSLIRLVIAKNILLSNDDGWASTNIRATYDALTNAGHNVIISAPVNQRSGYGGTFRLPHSRILLRDGEFGYVKKGDPSWGHEPDNLNIWYIDGTPSSSVIFGLDYIVPTYFNGMNIDLVVAGPNEGTTIGPYLFTLSGTMGATYTAIERNIPAISVSGSNSNNSFFKDDFPLSNIHPANINAQKVVQLVEYLFKRAADQERVLPLGIGLNVNIPRVGSISTNNLMNPPFKLSRLTGEGSFILSIELDEDTGLFKRYHKNTKALRNCLSGDCRLPSERTTYNEGKISISVFSVDYDAPYRQPAFQLQVDQVYENLSQLL